MIKEFVQEFKRAVRESKYKEGPLIEEFKYKRATNLNKY